MTGPFAFGCLRNFAYRMSVNITAQNKIIRNRRAATDVILSNGPFSRDEISE